MYYLFVEVAYHSETYSKVDFGLSKYTIVLMDFQRIRYVIGIWYKEMVFGYVLLKIEFRIIAWCVW